MKEDFGQVAFAVASRIAFPRKVGSRGEKEARVLVKAAFQEAGLEVSEEYFNCSDFAIRVAARWAMVPTGSLLVLSAFLFSRYPTFSALVAIVSLFPAAYISFRSRQGFYSPSRVIQYHTANILGRWPAEKVEGKTVLLMAHYDSKSQRFPIWLRVALFITTALFSALLIVLIVAGAVLQAINHPCPYQSWLLPAAFLLFLLDLSFLANTIGNQSDGALDNATGVGLITEIAKRLQEKSWPGINLLVLATAAEEIGLGGAVAYLRHHRQDLDPQRTLLLNFDGCGHGRAVHILKAYGFPPKKAPKDLVRTLEQIAAKHARALRSHYIPFGMATDLMPFTRAGYQGLDFIGPALKSHSPQDRMELVNEQTLGDYVHLACELITSWSGTN